MVRIMSIAGEQIYLRPLEREDLDERYLSWVSDPEVNRYFGGGMFPRNRDSFEPFFKRLNDTQAEVYFGIATQEADQFIGTIKLGSIVWVDRKATLAMMIGDKHFWGRGICTEAVRLMVEYGFFCLNLRRINLAVFAEHRAAVRCYEKAGFSVEGRFREALFHEGQYKDHLWMGLLRSEYRRPEGRPPAGQDGQGRSPG